MACIAHPPPEVAAIVAVAPSLKSQPSFRPVNRSSAHFVDGRGNLDFHCFRHRIRVRLTIQTHRVRFARHVALSFAYRAGAPKHPVRGQTRQFPGGVHRVGARTILFTYRNASDCGIPGGRPLCRRSAYGLYIADVAGRVRHIDPIIQNGGGSKTY